MNIREMKKRLLFLEEELEKAESGSEEEDKIIDEMVDLEEEYFEAILYQQNAYARARTPLPLLEILKKKYDRDVMLTLAEGLGLSASENGNLAEKLAERLLKPGIAGYFLMQLGLVDSAIVQTMSRQDGRMILDPTEKPRAVIDGLPYVYVNEYGCMELAKEYSVLYEKLLQAGFEEEHDKVIWMDMVLSFMAEIYGIAPKDMLCNLFRLKYDLEDDEIMQYYDILFEESKRAIVTGDEVIDGQLSSQMAEYLRTNRLDIPYYTPTCEAIEMYCSYGYTEKEQAHADVEKWFKKAGLEEREVKKIMSSMIFCFENDFLEDAYDRILDDLMDYGIEFRSRKSEAYFTELLRNMSVHTRNPLLRGSREIDVFPEEAKEYVRSGYVEYKKIYNLDVESQ